MTSLPPSFWYQREPQIVPTYYRQSDRQVRIVVFLPWKWRLTNICFHLTECQSEVQHDTEDCTATRCVFSVSECTNFSWCYCRYNREILHYDKNEQQGQGKSWSIVGRKQSQHRPWCPLTGHVDIRPDRHSSLQPDKDNNLRNFPIDSISFIQQIEVSWMSCADIMAVACYPAKLRTEVSSRSLIKDSFIISNQYNGETLKWIKNEMCFMFKFEYFSLFLLECHKIYSVDDITDW